VVDVSFRSRGILFALPVLAVLAAFWFLGLAPKREEASRLEDEVSQLQAAVNEQEQLVVAAEEARASFPRNYRKVVVLGKAVPEDADTSSLLVQLGRLAQESGVEFVGIKLMESGGGAPTAATPPPAEGAPAESAETAPAEAESGTEESAPAPATATEAAAAALPLGAVVGPAGLPIMPYELNFRGDFFAIADFVAKVNKMVELSRDGQPAAFGRLVTVDGFALSVPDETNSASSSSTALEATFAITTYVTPESEGATAGATPAGPAPPEASTPVSESTETAPPAPPAPPAASAGASVAGATP